MIDGGGGGPDPGAPALLLLQGPYGYMTTMSHIPHIDLFIECTQAPLTCYQVDTFQGQ